MLKQIVEALAPVLTLLISSLVSWAALELARWIRSKVQNQVLATALTRLEGAVLLSVREVAQTTVDAAKDAAAGGKLPKEVAEAAKLAAVAKARAYIGQPGLDRLMAVVGLKTDAELDALIGAQVEAQVHALKEQPVALVAPAVARP